MSAVATTDLCDSFEDRLELGTLEVFEPGYLSFGKVAAFAGPARTVKVFEDNVLVRQLLETPGAGQVLVVDGGASLRCALVGGKLAELGAAHGWAGIVVHGAVRDRAELDRADIGIRALGLQPRRSAKVGAGSVDTALRFSGVGVRPGDWVYADPDGILVSRERLAP